MPLEQHRLLEPQLETINVDRVAADGDAIPAPAHGTIRGSPCLLETELDLLHLGRGHRRFLEDGTDPLAGFDSIVEDLQGAQTRTNQPPHHA